MWKVYALLSALFAALTAIFAKVGVKDIPSNLATAIRTTVILLLTWGIVFVCRQQYAVREVSRQTWCFLVLSGLATGLSWLFPDFVIASPKNLHQRVWRFSDALPSTLSECIHPCSEVA